MGPTLINRSSPPSNYGRSVLPVTMFLTLIYFILLSIVSAVQHPGNIPAQYEIFKATNGADHPDTLKAMDRLATMYQQQGDYASALPLFLGCLEKRKTILGSNHEDTIASMNNLALLYSDQGDYKSALPLYLGCLEKITILA